MASTRLLTAVIAVATALLVSIGVLAPGKRGTLQHAHRPLTETIHSLFTQGIPSPPKGTSHWWELAVSLGNPKVFILVVALLTARAWKLNDRRAALYAASLPVIATLAAEEILKPLFGHVRGNAYSYPSGHVTSATAIAIVILVIAQRHVPHRLIIPVTVASCALVAFASLGVVVLHMHDGLDAIGGIALASGLGALGAIILQAWDRTSADVQVAKVPH